MNEHRALLDAIELGMDILGTLGAITHNQTWTEESWYLHQLDALAQIAGYDDARDLVQSREYTRRRREPWDGTGPFP